MNRIRLVSSTLLLTLITLTTYSQTLVTTTGLTPTQYVQDVLLGSGVTVSGVTYTGSPDAIGKFNVVGAPNTLNLDSGLVLTTGTVLNTGVGPQGPNNSGSAGVDNGQPGDADLNILGGSTGSFNAAILEFDFVPASDTVKFDFVFGSEEYMEFVNSGVSDAFGFFLSGPGIVGPYTNSAINIALVPSTNTPISIDSLNAGVNGTYYVDNETPPGNLLQYDGHTVVMTALAIVECNQQYHIKIAIGDQGDGVWDSGVFLKGGSFSSNGIQIAGGAIDSSGVNTSDSIFVEGCEMAAYFFSRPDSNGVDTIFIGTTGTATMGQDYNNIPPFIVVDQGEFQDSILITANVDGITEPIETITLFIVFNNPCGSDTVFKTLYLEDYTPMTAYLGGDTTWCPSLVGAPVLDPQVSGGYGNYHYLWYPTQDTTDTILGIANENMVFYATIEDDCGKAITTAPVNINIQCPIVIPNVITANEDGLNDTFVIQNIDQYPANKVWFYDRWGIELYHTSQYKNDWTPRVVDGVYYYVVDNGVDDPYKGFFTVFASTK